MVAAHPGVVRTSLGRDFPRPLVLAVNALALSPVRGAEPVTALATQPRIRSGAYYDRFEAVRSSRASYDTAVAARLWAVTEQLRGQFDRQPQDDRS